MREARVGMDAAAKTDAYIGMFARLLVGRIYAAIGRNDDAITILHGLMEGICRVTPPNEIRHDPCWSRLKDDPRFEEILSAAKPL